uniref:Uncharacterized protein n=1 Tax=Ananas comosus var. bracteatus TaxID=296719 RepID=A0A6V7P959_ANACO|nr:unnamed protein product [Ananas comosus var. bracteatus]
MSRRLAEEHDQAPKLLRQQPLRLAHHQRILDPPQRRRQHVAAAVGGAKIRCRRRRQRAFGRRAVRAAPSLCRQVPAPVPGQHRPHRPPALQRPRQALGRRRGTSSAVIVGCEVVLFEHLLWMLRNGDVHPELTPDDLVDFYAC